MRVDTLWGSEIQRAETIRSGIAKTALAIVAWAMTATGAGAHDMEDTQRQANDAYARGDYAESASLFEDAVAQGARDATTPYNGACAFALAGQVDHAYRLLDLAISRRFRDLALLTSDTDLGVLHDDPR